MQQQYVQHHAAPYPTCKHTLQTQHRSDGHRGHINTVVPPVRHRAAARPSLEAHLMYLKVRCEQPARCPDSFRSSAGALKQDRPRHGWSFLPINSPKTGRFPTSYYTGNPHGNMNFSWRLGRAPPLSEYINEILFYFIKIDYAHVTAAGDIQASAKLALQCFPYRMHP